MINEIKALASTLMEDIKYYDNAVSYKKSLESTLWGLEQQAQYPENSSKEEQDDLSVEINRCRVKVLSLDKLLKDQENKIMSVLSSFTSNNQDSCKGCP